MELEMFHEIKTAFYEKICGNSSVGRALASQAGGREFEPRLPLTAHIDNQGVIFKI